MEDLLRALIAFPTVSGNLQAADDCLQYISGQLQASGMHVREYRWNGYPSLVATSQPDSKRPRIMFAAHADVVPAASGDFVLQYKNGAYLGRGVLDMKFAIAAYLSLVQDLQPSLQEYDFGIMITSDEEVGGLDGTARLVDEGYIPDVCVLPDGGDNWNIQTASKGFIAFQIKAQGIAAHGSRPWQGDNAIIKLLTVHDQITALFPPEAGPDTNTVSINQITGGEAMNQIPGEATMSIDIRTINRQEHSRLFHAVTDICHANGVSYEHIGDASPTAFDLQDPLIAPFAHAVTKYTGVKQQGYLAMGASDVRYYVPYGVPCISVYPAGGHHHAAHEWLDAQALHDFKTIITDYVNQVARRQH